MGQLQLEAAETHAPTRAAAPAARGTYGFVQAVDYSGLGMLVLFILLALGSPNDPLNWAKLATVICIWLTVRCLAVCSCGGHWWPAPGLIYIMITILTGHIGGFAEYYDHQFSPPSAAWIMIWAFDLAYLAFALGTWVYTRFTRLNADRLISQFYARPLALPPGQDGLVIPTILLFLIGLAGAVALTGGHLPLFSVLKMIAHGDFFGVRAVSASARHGLYSSSAHPAQGYLSQFKVGILPMIVLLWFVCWRINGRLLYRILFFIGLACTVVILTSSLERGVLLLFMIQVGLTSAMLYPMRPSVRWLYWIAGGFVVLVILSILLGRDVVHGGFLPNLIKQVNGAFLRIYVAGSQSNVKVFELFPQTLHFRNGMTWLNDARNILPGPGTGFNAELFSYFGKGPGSAAPHFIAEMWANGGWLGVLFVSFLNGMFMQWVNLQGLALRHRTPLNLTLMALLIFCFGMQSGGLTSPILHGLVTFLMVDWLLKQLLRIAPAARVRPPAVPDPNAPAAVQSAA